MNERIKELADQATEYTNQQNTFDPRTEFTKKFAELLVQECAGIALKSGSVPNKSEVAVAEADRIYHKIKAHFGVEE